jgi:hypothetical protein
MTHAASWPLSTLKLSLDAALVCLSSLYSTWTSYLDLDNPENLKSLKSPPYKLSRFKLIPAKLKDALPSIPAVFLPALSWVTCRMASNLAP